MTLDTQTSQDPIEQFQQEIQDDLDQSRRALKEITLMLEQSQTELAKLNQRNATITGHLQQIQGQIETLPRSDIRLAYNAALEGQQRVLVMRGQFEKLQSDQSNLQRYIALLEKAQSMLGLERGGDKSSSGGHQTGSAVLEKVVNAQEAERQRLSRQMHDGPAQALSNFIVQTEIASRMFDVDPSRAKEELTNLKNSATSTFHKVRGFIFELRPMMLDDLGLYPTLNQYINSFKEQNGIEITLTIKGEERRMKPFIEVMIFRAVQELLYNAYHHNMDNSARLVINVQLWHDENLVRVSVNDNGRGFDPQVAEKSDGFGLKLIRERVEMLGGYMEVESGVGQGCRIAFQIPNPEPVAADSE